MSRKSVQLKILIITKSSHGTYILCSLHSMKKHLIALFWNCQLKSFLYFKMSWLYSEFSIDIPPKTYRNGTMFLHMVLVNDIGVEFEWRNLKREGLTVLQRIPLTEYIVPRPATFNLLNENEVCEMFHWNCSLIANSNMVTFMVVFRPNLSHQNSRNQSHIGSQNCSLQF